MTLECRSHHLVAWSFYHQFSREALPFKRARVQIQRDFYHFVSVGHAWWWNIRDHCRQVASDHIKNLPLHSRPRLVEMTLMKRSEIFHLLLKLILKGKKRIFLAITPSTCSIYIVTCSALHVAKNIQNIIHVLNIKKEDD